MKWPLMTAEEIHAFGIDAILPYIQKEGVIVDRINRNPIVYPQVIGKRWDSLAFIFVRTSVYPDKGELTNDEFSKFLSWSENHGAIAFFASVGLACTHYPDKTEVNNDSDMRLPIRHGGYAVAYPGLVVMTTFDQVKIWGEDTNSLQ